MVTVNSVIVPLGEGSGFVLSRIIFIAASPSGRTLFVIPLATQALPIAVPEIQLKHALEQQKIKLSASAPAAKKRRPEDLPERYVKLRDAAWKRIEPLVNEDCLPLLMDRETRGSLIASRGRELNCQPTQLYRDLYRFFRGGMDRDALYPDYKSVEIGSHPPDGQRKRGRKPAEVKNGKQPNNPPVTSVERAKIAAIIKKQANAGVTKEDIFETVNELLRHSSVVQEGSKTTYVLLPPHLLITKAQFLRIFDEADEGNAISRRLVGAIEWNSKNKWRKSRSHADVGGPGQRFEVDWCGTQVELVARDHPDRKIGTAIVYFVVDTWSNLVVGFHVTIAGASWDSASLALFNAICDKKTYFEHYDIPYPEEDYKNVQGCPFAFRGDRGPEVISFASYSAVHGTGSDMQNSRRMQPRDKADVESVNSIFKRKLFKRLAGFRPKMKKIVARNPRKDACLTLYDLIRIVMLEIIQCNRRPLALASVPSIARKAGVKPTPIALWNWGLTNVTGYLRKEDPDALYTKLLPESDALITENGLKWKKFLYTSPELERLDVFSSARRKGRGTPVKIRVDPMRPWLVFIPKLKGHGYWECSRIDPEGHYEQYLFEDAEQESKAHSEKTKAIRQEETQAISDKKAEQAAIQRRAKVRAKEAGASGPGGTTARVRRQRSEEREISAQEQRRIVLRNGKPDPAPKARKESKIVSRIQDQLTKQIVAAMGSR